jgi:ERCC4-type nuclease
MAKNNISFDVLIDTKEKIPWNLAGMECVKSVAHCHLETGDYTIEGLEHVLCIERKKSVAELAKNITEDRFKRELERMQKFPYKFILLEFGYGHIDDYPHGSGIPEDKIKLVRVKGPFIRAAIARMEIKYDIHIVSCGHTAYAEEKACNIMKEVYRRHAN